MAPSPASSSSCSPVFSAVVKSYPDTTSGSEHYMANFYLDNERKRGA